MSSPLEKAKPTDININAELEEIYKGLQKFAEVIANLESRLEPVLKPDEMAERKDPDSTDPQRSPMAATLASDRRELNRLVYRLDTLNRLIDL